MNCDERSHVRDLTSIEQIGTRDRKAIREEALPSVYSVQKREETTLDDGIINSFYSF